MHVLGARALTLFACRCSPRVSVVFVTPQWRDIDAKRIHHAAAKDRREIYVVRVTRRLPRVMYAGAPLTSPLASCVIVTCRTTRTSCTA